MEQRLAVIWRWCYEILTSSIYQGALADFIRLINVNMSSATRVSCIHVSIYVGTLYTQYGLSVWPWA